MKLEVGKDLESITEKINSAKYTCEILGKKPTHLIVSEAIATQLLIEQLYPSRNDFIDPNEVKPEKLVGAHLLGLECMVDTNKGLRIEVLCLLDP
jgi:hypothetical protein